MESLLSPEEAAAWLCDPRVDPMLVFARLDVDACHFTPRVDTKKQPLVDTHYAGIGAPATGKLAFSAEDVESIRAENVLPIFVWDGQEDTRFEGIKKFSCSRASIIFTSGKTGKRKAFLDSHFLVKAHYCSSAFIDHPEKPRLILNKRKKHLVLENGNTLKGGDDITMEPCSGLLWRGTIPISPPPDYFIELGSRLQEQFGRTPYPSIACSIPRRLHAGNVFYDVYSNTPLVNSIGLYRTESELRDRYFRSKKTLFRHLQKKRTPPALEHWDAFTFEDDPIMSFRLTDLTHMIDILPQHIVQEFQDKQDHVVGSRAFILRSDLYRIQIKNSLSGWLECGNSITHPKTYIVPAVTNADEVLYFKRVVTDTANKILGDKARLVRFGVMVETKEALENIESITPHCDSLCLGLNDGTEALTGCSRKRLDHSAWMRQRGYAGASPFSVVVPEVLSHYAEALARARRVKPDIFTNVCGNQTAGHHIPSIEAFLGLGVNQFTVPPSRENALRTMAAIVRYHARQKLGLTRSLV